MKKDISQAIYRELINGNFINKTKFENSHIVPNPLFDEISNEQNREQYVSLYTNIGYELKQIGDSFFINELYKDSELSEVAAKIQALLLVIFRGITQIPLVTSIVVDESSGLNKAHLERFADNEEYQRILRAVDLKKGLLKEVDNVLITRKIAYWNHMDNLVLTDSGKAIVEYMQLSE